MFTVSQTPRKNYSYNTQYTPQYSSPLSSSPLRSSPSPLKERCDNLPMLKMANSTNHSNDESGKDMIMSSPTSHVKRAGGFEMYQEQQQQQQRREEDQENNEMGKLIFSPQYTMVAATPSSSQYRSHTGGALPIPTPPSSHRNRGNFSKRAIKPNPLMSRERGSSSEEGRETRRKLFLKKVREGSDDKAWERRGGEEEMLRCLWVGERGREIERQRVEGRMMDAVEENLDEIMADEVAMMERLELEALVESQIQEVESQPPPQHEYTTSALWVLEQQLQLQSAAPTPTNTNYGSDDDEYDSIFQDVIEEELRMSQQTQQDIPQEEQDQDMMDMS